MSESVMRIAKYIDYKGITVKSVEQRLGMSNGSLGSQIKNGKSIGSDKIENFLSQYTEVSAEWLTRGIGDMIRDDGQLPTTSNQNQLSTNMAANEEIKMLRDKINDLERIISEKERTIRVLEQLADKRFPTDTNIKDDLQ